MCEKNVSSEAKMISDQTFLFSVNGGTRKKSLVQFSLLTAISHVNWKNKIYFLADPARIINR